MRITLEKRLCMIRIIWPPPSWFNSSIGPAQRYRFDNRYFIGSVIFIGLSTNGFSQWKSHFDERKQGWLVQKFGLRRLQRLSPPHQQENKRRLCSKSFIPGGRGYSLWWPIWGGSARKRYIFRLEVYERVGILLVEVYKRVGKSVIKGLMNNEFYGFIKLRKRSIFVIDFYLKDSALQ